MGICIDLSLFGGGGRLCVIDGGGKKFFPRGKLALRIGPYFSTITSAEIGEVSSLAISVRVGAERGTSDGHAQAR